MNNIELAVYGRRNDLGFCNILAIDWQGNVIDRPPLGRFYLDGRVADLVISDTHEIYRLAIDKVYNKRDPRAHVLQFCLRIPRSHELVRDGVAVSPLSVLRQVADKYVGDYLKPVQDTYRYDKTDDAPREMLVDVYRSMLTPYTTRKVWGSHTMMSGSKEAYINADSDADADRLMLELPWVARLSNVKSVEVGRFTSDLPLLALSDAERTHTPRVDVHVKDADGVNQLVLLNVKPEVFRSKDFGYSDEVYEPVEFKLSKDDVLKAFADGTALPQVPGATIQILPDECAVAVTFVPSKRRKSFTIRLEGVAAEDQAAVFDGLLYNGKAVINRTLTFVGEDILKFKLLKSDTLTKAFALNSNDYKLKSVFQVEGNVTIRLEKIDKEPAKAVRRKVKSTTEDMFADAAMYQTNSAEQAVLLRLPNEVEGSVEVVVGQRSKHVHLVEVRELESYKDKTGHRVVDFTINTLPNAAIRFSVGRPAKYFAETDGITRENGALAVNCYRKKNPIVRFFNSFAFKTVSSEWVIARWVTIIVLALLLLFGAFIGGAIAMHFGKVETISGWFAPAATAASVQATTTETVHPDSKSADTQSAVGEAGTAPVPDAGTEAMEADKTDAGQSANAQETKKSVEPENVDAATDASANAVTGDKQGK
ncbi:MAG: hypothetical protein K2M55_03860 [Muribaculaceae bacterium]|nr:hypothetical protein [Muribaculaceae bacterium]